MHLLSILTIHRDRPYLRDVDELGQFKYKIGRSKWKSRDRAGTKIYWSGETWLLDGPAGQLEMELGQADDSRMPPSRAYWRATTCRMRIALTPGRLQPACRYRYR